MGGLRLHVWHRSACMGAYHSMRDELEGQVRLQQCDGALRRLQLASVGMVEGKLEMQGGRVVVVCSAVCETYSCGTSDR